MHRTGLLLSALFLFGAVLWFPRHAHADVYEQFLTVSCVQEISYFSLHSSGIYNPKEGAVEKSPHTFTVQELEQNPYHCTLNDSVEIVVKGLCLHAISPEAVACAPGLEGRIQEFAIFVNDQILPLVDPPFRTAENKDWLSIVEQRQMVEISAYAPYGSQQGKLNSLNCRFPESYPLRYQPENPKFPLAMECWTIEKILSPTP